MSSVPPVPPPPPPPPQPPPLPTFKTRKSGGIVLEEKSYYRGAMLDALCTCMRHLTTRYGEECLQDLKYLGFYRPVTPVTQIGPLCGLVALAMGAPLAGVEGVTAETLLVQARDRGYTLQGEMFSAEALCELSKSVLGSLYTADVVQQAGHQEVLQLLLNGDILLVPYDADRNHEPCLRKGHKAHWVLITGFLVAIETESQDKYIFAQLEDEQEYYEASMFHLSLPVMHEIVKDRLENVRSVFVCGHHGKSRHPASWSLQDLLDSNQNLTEIGPERTDSDYVVPSGGIKQGLCGKIVRFFKAEPPVAEKKL